MGNQIPHKQVFNTFVINLMILNKKYRCIHCDPLAKAFRTQIHQIEGLRAGIWLYSPLHITACFACLLCLWIYNDFCQQFCTCLENICQCECVLSAYVVFGSPPWLTYQHHASIDNLTRLSLIINTNSTDIGGGN